MKPETRRTVIVVAGAVVVTTGLMIAYFGILKPIFNKLGLTNDKDDRDAAKLDEEEAFNPSHARNKPNRVTISQSKANNLAQQVYGAKGYIYDDEDAAIGAVRDTGTTYNLSYMAGRFNAIYGRDLLGYMKTFMSTEDLATVYKAIKNFEQ